MVAVKGGSGERGDVVALTVVRVMVAAVGTAIDCGSGESKAKAWRQGGGGKAEGVTVKLVEVTLGVLGIMVEEVVSVEEVKVSMRVEVALEAVVKSGGVALEV